MIAITIMWTPENTIRCRRCDLKDRLHLLRLLRILLLPRETGNGNVIGCSRNAPAGLSRRTRLPLSQRPVSHRPAQARKGAP